MQKLVKDVVITVALGLRDNTRLQGEKKRMSPYGRATPRSAYLFEQICAAQTGIQGKAVSKQQNSARHMHDMKHNTRNGNV